MDTHTLQAHPLRKRYPDAQIIDHPNTAVIQAVIIHRQPSWFIDQPKGESDFDKIPGNNHVIILQLAMHIASDADNDNGNRIINDQLPIRQPHCHCYLSTYESQSTILPGAGVFPVSLLFSFRDNSDTGFYDRRQPSPSSMPPYSLGKPSVICSCYMWAGKGQKPALASVVTLYHQTAQFSMTREEVGDAPYIPKETRHLRSWQNNMWGWCGDGHRFYR